MEEKGVLLDQGALSLYISGSFIGSACKPGGKKAALYYCPNETEVFICERAFVPKTFVANS